MACSVSETKIRGFFLELIEANLTVGVIDIFSDPIPSAKIIVDTGYSIEEDFTDKKGIARFTLPPDFECNIKVEKGLYHLYQSDFIATSVDNLGSGVNFPFLVRDKISNTLLTTPSAIIDYYQDEVLIDSMEVEVNAEDIYEGIFRYGYTNRISIDGDTNGEFTMDINTFLNIELENTGYKVIPIIQLI